MRFSRGIGKKYLWVDSVRDRSQLVVRIS
jgi:hypothetical protein